MPEGVTVGVLSAADYPAAIPDLAALLVDAVESGASVSFLRGLDQSRAETWWHGRADDVTAGTLVMVVARDGRADRRLCRAGGREGGEQQPSGRGRQGARAPQSPTTAASRRRSCRGAEAEALARGRWLLMLDAVAGGGPEALYRASGWQVLGVVPDFAVSTDGELQPCVFMWKRLDPVTALRVLVAPDSFKGSLTSVQVARALADGWSRGRPDDAVALAPLADGGEGTLDADQRGGRLDHAAGGSTRSADAPAGRTIPASG